MLKGTVKFYNRQKGFGFITRDDGTDDLFVSASSLAASGLKTLDVGQRVSFQVEKDPRGSKAADIKLDAPPPQSPAPQPSAAQPAPQQVPAAPRLTVYYDPSRESHRDVADAIGEKGDAPRLVDYVTSPPARDELKRLSLLLGANEQSLVRRYDPLFLELQLDDRFISEAEFWGAIVEHPKLIDGPVLASGNRARLCKTVADAKGFFQDKQPKPAKSVSPRILAMIQGHAVPPPEKPVAEKPVAEKPVAEKPAPEKAQIAAPVKAAPVEAAANPVKKTLPQKPSKPQPKAKVPAKPAAKPKKAVKAKAPAKPAAKKAAKPKPAKAKPARR